MRHDLILLTADNDFVHAAAHCSLRVWKWVRLRRVLVLAIPTRLLSV
jgi:hypothetical protein